MPFVVGEQVGVYRIVEQLGHGGMSTVYKAYHAALDRYVALKVLHPVFKGDQDFMARFQREARIVARLEHPHIVPVYDYSEHEGTPFLVMRYVEGRTLKAVLTEQGALPLERVGEILSPVCEALQYAHAHGVLHRDIKPSNILLSREGKVYVTDFGLAKMVQSGDSTISQDRMIGTPQYISPEQAKGEKLDHRTDLYSLGVILFEMVTGRVPYTADTPFAVVHDHIFSPLPLPSTLNPEVPAAVEQVVLKALAKVPDDRFADAEEFLNAVLHTVPRAGRPGTALPLEGAVQPVAAAAVPDVPAPESAAVSPAPPDALSTPEGTAAEVFPVPIPAESTAVTPSPGAAFPASEGAVLAPPAGPAFQQEEEVAVEGLSEVAGEAAAAPARPRYWPAWKYGLLGGGIALALLIVFLVVTVLRERAARRSVPADAPPVPVLRAADLPPGIAVFPIRAGEGYARPGEIPPEELAARLEDLQRQIDQNPRDPFLYLEMGNLLYQAERWEEASGAYYQAFELAPELADAHYNKGVVLLYMREPEEALGEFMRALELRGGEGDPPLYYNLGLTHAVLGHRREAVTALREFLQRWPQEDAWRKRALEVLRRWGEEE